MVIFSPISISDNQHGQLYLPLVALQLEGIFFKVKGFFRQSWNYNVGFFLTPLVSIQYNQRVKMIDLLFGAKLWLTSNLLQLHLGHVLKLRRFWYTKYFTYLHINVKECVVSHYFFLGILIMIKSISTSRTAPRCDDKKCDGYSF